MKKLIFLCTIVCTILLIPAMTTHASTAASVTQAQYEDWKNQHLGENMIPPVDVQDSELIINGAAQSARLQEVDLSMPGKNGLDVNLIRLYNTKPDVATEKFSPSSVVNEKVLRMRYKNASGTKRYVDFMSEDEYFQNDTNGLYVDFNSTHTLYSRIKKSNGTHVTRDTTYTPQWVYASFTGDKILYEMDMYGGVKLMDNWDLALPKLTSTYSVADSFGSNLHFYQELVFPDGRMYTIKHTYTVNASETTLTTFSGDFTESSDFVVLEPKAGDPNGDKTDTERGISYAFVFRDKAGMLYFFNTDGQLVWQEDRFGNAIKYAYLSDGFEITDTMGRKIRYTALDTNGQIGKISVTADNVTKDMVYYEYAFEDANDAFEYNDRHYLKVKKIETGESAPNCDNVTSYQMAKRTNLYSYNVENYYKMPFTTMALLKIEKPNNAYSAFTYENQSGRNVVVSSETVENNTVMNRWTYAYGANSMTKTRQDGYVESCVYDSSNRLILVSRDGDGIREDEGFTYGENGKKAGAATDKLYQTYRQIFRSPDTDMYDYVELVTNYETDARDHYTYENYMGREVWYDYGTAETNPYNFMLSKIYENEGQEIKIVNTLTSDLKGIAETKEYVKENGTFVEKSVTSYTYDTYGNVSKETVRPTSSETIETHYVYTYNGSAFSVERYIMETNGQKTSVIQKYDAFGRLVEETDANGNKTTYTYDDLSRLTRITYADNTARTYSYDVQNNRITAVNENGTEIRQSYDAFGREKKTEVKNDQGTYITLQENTYHAASGNLAAVTEMGAGNKRVRTEYTWDDAGNVTEKVVKTENASGTFTETDRVTATYSAPSETGTRIPNAYGTYMENCEENWAAGTKYEWNCTTQLSGMEFYLNGEYDYVLVNIRAEWPVQIGMYGGENTEYMYKSRITSNDEANYFYRSCIIDVKDVDSIYVDPDPIYEFGFCMYNFRAYTKEDIDALVTKVQTTQTGDSTITPPKTETRIDIWGNVVYNKLTDASTGDVLAEEFSRFDDLGNEIAYRNPVSYDLGQDTISRTYNYRGQVLTETTNDSVLGTSTQSVAYDNIGRVISETDANGNTTNYTYDKLGRVIRKTYPVDNSQTGEILYTYDKNGNVTKEEVKNGNTYDTVEYAYDSKNRVIRMTAYPEANKPQITQYYYDNTGNVLRMYTGLSAPLTIHGLDNVTANGDSDYHVTKYTYNFMGYPVKMTDSLGQDETYTVDYLGNVLSKTDRNGDTVTTTYNYMGLPLSVTASNGNKTITYTYDKLGNRTKMVDETGTTNYTYSDLSQLIGETKGTISKTYTYDKNGSRTGFTLKEGTTTRLSNTYTVGSTGILSAMTSGTDSVAYTYDSNRNMLTETINDTLSQTNQYNKANQATVVQNKNGTSLHSQFAYTYSTNGNMLTIWEQLGSAGVEGREFEYDGMGRLTSEVLGTDLLSYSFDDFGNRASMTKQNKTTSFVYDANNRLTGSTHPDTQTTYSYDDNGSLTAEAATGTDATNGTYTYDGLGRLTSLTKDGKTVSYAYNGDGQRVSKTVNGTTTQYVWDGDYIVMEKTGNSVTVYKRAQNLFASEKDGTKTFYRYNVRGDVVQLTNASYTVTKTYRYDAFGNEQNPDANDTNPFRYCGEYFDAETGYIYLRARYYDPAVGRFISEDSIRDGLNWYVYCGNNPVMFVDPSGMKKVWIREWIESKNGTVTPNKKWFGLFGLKSITVSLPGQKSRTYYKGKNGYTIRNDLAYIDDSILNTDFKTDGVYRALIVAYGERGTTGKAAREWMSNLYPNFFNPSKDFWCITFVSWVLAQSELPGPETFSVAVAIDWYTNRGMYHLTANGATPNIGDTMFINTAHSGLVIAYDPPWVYTIEGCSAGDKVNVVKRHESTITAYGDNGGNENGVIPSEYDYVKR